MERWQLFVVLFFMPFLLTASLIFIVVEQQTLHARRDVFEAKLNSYGVEIQEGIIKSPAVIIKLESQDAFISKVRELNAVVVYIEESAAIGRHYYVFTNDYNIAYRYTFT